jgi:hypothetical protein
LTRVAVLMVAYGRWELTRECVASLLASKGVDPRITLVDNGAGSPPEWVRRTKGLRYHRAEGNLGFAAGMNLAFALSAEDGAPLSIVVNNDTVFPSDTLHGLAELLRSRGDAGAAGPPVLFADDPGKVWSAGGFLRGWTMRYRQRRWASRADLPEAPVEVDMLSGCALMVRTGLFERLGGFREDLFMYYEDADLCRRITGTGRKVLLAPASGVLHRVESSSRSRPWLPAYCSQRNRLLLSRELQTPVQRAFFAAWMTAAALLKTPWLALTGRPGRVRWLWRALADGLAGRGGPPRGIG